MTHVLPPDGTRTRASSDRFYELGRMSRALLETALMRGVKPLAESLEGWEFRGMNTPAWASLLGIKKFVKGFFKRGRETFGYNCPVIQNGIESQWVTRPSDDQPRRFGFYKVVDVDPEARDNAYLHATLLDYGQGENFRMDPVRGLRDYLVLVDSSNDDLYLGKAYYALGPFRVAVSFFVLERHRKTPY